MNEFLLYSPLKALGETVLYAFQEQVVYGEDILSLVYDIGLYDLSTCSPWGYGKFDGLTIFD